MQGGLLGAGTIGIKLIVSKMLNIADDVSQYVSGTHTFIKAVIHTLKVVPVMLFRSFGMKKKCLCLKSQLKSLFFKLSIPR